MRKKEIGKRDDSSGITIPEDSKRFKPVIKSVLFVPNKVAHQEGLVLYLWDLCVDSFSQYLIYYVSEKSRTVC